MLLSAAKNFGAIGQVAALMSHARASFLISQLGQRLRATAALYFERLTIPQLWVSVAKSIKPLRVEIISQEKAALTHTIL